MRPVNKQQRLLHQTHHNPNTTREPGPVPYAVWTNHHTHTIHHTPKHNAHTPPAARRAATGAATPQALHSTPQHARLRNLDTPGIEPGAFRLQSGRATTALCAQYIRLYQPTFSQTQIHPNTGPHSLPLVFAVFCDSLVHSMHPIASYRTTL